MFVGDEQIRKPCGVDILAVHASTSFSTTPHESLTTSVFRSSSSWYFKQEHETRDPVCSLAGWVCFRQNPFSVLSYTRAGRRFLPFTCSASFFLELFTGTAIDSPVSFPFLDGINFHAPP
jgi:hypothetical protein